MHFPSTFIFLLASTAPLVLAVGEDKVVKPHDGTLAYCTEPNFKGHCRARWFKDNTCYNTPKTNVTGHNWQSFHVTEGNATCNFWTGKYCDKGHSTGWHDQMEEMTGNKTYHSHKCKKVKK